MSKRFTDRTDAGRQLAALLTHLRGQNLLVLALPRGGLPVAYEVAHALHAPLDVLNVRKLGVPWQEELAMGAIATGDVRVLNDEVIIAAGITKAALDEVTALQRLELDRRERLYRSGRPAPELRGRTIVLVDDGIATGATVRAAIAVVRSQKPARVALAVPVAQQSVAGAPARGRRIRLRQRTRRPLCDRARVRSLPAAHRPGRADDSRTRGGRDSGGAHGCSTAIRGARR
jgi:predicted phosphoribosyltransferase